MLPKNLQIKKDFEAGIIKHQGYHNALIGFALLVFCLIAIGINYIMFNFTSYTTNFGGYFFFWGLIGAFVSQRINKETGTGADFILSFPLYISAIIVAYPIDFLYRTIKGK